MSQNSRLCSKCHRDFDDIKNHKNIFHRGMEEKWCKNCGRLFSNMSKFRKHFIEHQSANDDDRKECYICQSKFDDLNIFKKHLEHHSCLHIHPCHKCSKTFMFYNNYTKHLSSVHFEEPPATNIAELSFDDTGDEKLLDFDLKTVDDDASTVLHKKTTEDNTSTDSNKNTIDDAVNIMGDGASPNLHDESMDVSFLSQGANSNCVKCNRDFQDFKLHEYFFHRNKNQLICEMCGRQFYKLKRYLSHKIEHKSNEMKCYVCNKDKFDSFRSFMKHFECHDELHVYFCSECSVSFATKLKFDKHFKKQHNQSKDDTVIEISPDKPEPIDKNTDVKINRKNNLMNIDESEELINGDKSNELTPLDLIRHLKDKEKNDKTIKKKKGEADLYNRKQISARSSYNYNSIGESNNTFDSTLNDEDLDISLLDQGVDQTCFVCNEKFSKRSGYNVYNHWLTEHNDYSRNCKICNKHILKPSHLYYHSMKHDDKYPWPCSMCDNKFKNYYALRDHITCVHKKIENYICTICDKKFIFQFTYSCHLRTHNNETKFKCEYCSKQFHWKRILIPHLKFRRCKFCDIDLPCRTLYDDHFTNRHMKERLFNCRYCNTSYQTKAQLRGHCTVKHLDLVTKTIEYCKYCKFMTNNKRNINKHVKIHHTTE